MSFKPISITGVQTIHKKDQSGNRDVHLGMIWLPKHTLCDAWRIWWVILLGKNGTSGVVELLKEENERKKQER